MSSILAPPTWPSSAPPGTVPGIRPPVPGAPPRRDGRAHPRHRVRAGRLHSPGRVHGQRVHASRPAEVVPTRSLASVWVILAYLAVSVAGHWNVWLSPGTRLVGPPDADPIQTAWFLGWMPGALAHHHGLFFTSRINYPYGFNLLDSTSIALLGLIAAPITVAFGPIVSVNVLGTLSMAGSATAAWFLIRRWVSWRPAAFVGGLLYGFSPYMIAAGTIHLDLAVTFIPPLVLLVLDKVLVRESGTPWRWGLLLGALASAQFFIAGEVLATTVLLSAIGLLLLALTHPLAAVRRGRRAASLLATATCVTGAVLGYPIWLMFRGRGHIHGPIQLTPQAYRADLLGSIVPGRYQAIAPAAARDLSAHFVSGYTWENGSYLGVTLIAVLVIGTFLIRRKPLLRFSVLMAAVAYILSLGVRLAVSGTPDRFAATGTRLPEGWFGHLPFFASVIPARFSLYVDLFCAIALAVVVDSLASGWAAHPGANRRHGRPLTVTVGRAAAGSVALIALAPLVPAWPYPVTRVDVPRFLSTAAVAIPAGSTVVTYPYPGEREDAAPLLWQAETGYRFRLPGGYFVLPQAGNGAAGVGRWTPTSSVFDQLFDGATLPESEATRASLRAEWSAWHVSALLAEPAGRDPARAVAYLTWLVGRPPTVIGGLDLWYRPSG